MPKFKLEDIEDYYTYYVCILGMSEEMFFHADISFLLSVSDNKAAYDSWLSNVKDRLFKR